MRTASSRGRPIGDARPPIAGSATSVTRTDADDARDMVMMSECGRTTHSDERFGSVDEKSTIVLIAFFSVKY
jgi:hypothetical protein